MPKQFFNIPLPQHEGLVELQAYLRTELKEATFQDPDTFHITLVHVEETGEADLSSIEIPYAPIFGVGGDYLRVFSTPEGYAVTLEILPVPQLIYLQAWLFYKVRAMGLDVSTLSWPGLWKPHVTLARTMVEPPFLSVPTMVHFEVDNFVLTADGYEEVARFPLAQTTAAGEAVREMAAIRDSMVVTEFKGSYPTIKEFPDVDIEALTEGDKDQKGGFVVLKIAKDDATSRNKRFYSKDFVRELEKWVFENRPIGIQGHLKDEDRGSEYPTPSIYWIGTAKVGDTLWAKGYIPPGETREMVKNLMATNGKIATSIYGNAAMTWDAQRGVWNVSSDLSNLEQIDLAPPTRAGIPELAVVPQLSKEISEMADDDPSPTEDENPMNKLQVIQELQATDARLLPEVVVNAVTEAAVKPLQTQIAEIAKGLSVEPDGIAAKIVELVGIAEKHETVRQQQLETLIVSTVAEMVYPDAETVTDLMKSARQMVVEQVKSRQPADEAAIKEAVKTVSEMEHNAAIIKAGVVKEMGPSLKRQPKPTSGSDKKSPYMKARPQSAKEKAS